VQSVATADASVTALNLTRRAYTVATPHHKDQDPRTSAAMSDRLLMNRRLGEVIGADGP
jgi:hypothetical protein